MTAVTEASQITLLRVAPAVKKAKEMKAAAETLGASSVILRACGMWIDERGEDIDLTKLKVPIRDVKSVWVEVSVNGLWVKVRPNSDPHLQGNDVPTIEVESVFND